MPAATAPSRVTPKPMPAANGPNAGSTASATCPVFRSRPTSTRPRTNPAGTATAAATRATAAASPTIMRRSWPPVAPARRSRATCSARCRTARLSVEVTAKATMIRHQPPPTPAVVISDSWLAGSAPAAVSNRDANAISRVAPRKADRKVAMKPPGRCRRLRSATAIIR
jgi:hypothetical protein